MLNPQPCANIAINKIIEIKSSWTYDEQNMNDRFQSYQEQGYLTECIIWDKENPLGD